MQDHLVRAVGSDWPAQCAHLSRQSSLIGDLLAGARPAFARPAATAAIPYGFLRAQPIAPEVFPVGDQLAVVPSFTGDGMAIALYSGLAAAQAVLAGQPAATYQRELIRRLRPQFRLAGSIGRRARNAGDVRHRRCGGEASAAACHRHGYGNQAQGIWRYRGFARRSEIDGDEIGRKAGAEGGQQMRSAGAGPQRALQDEQRRRR